MKTRPAKRFSSWLRARPGVKELDHKALEFQPDSVELEKQPVPIFIRATYYLLLALVVCALTWSIVARMDMIVTARGRLISTGKQVLVQPLVNSIIKKFHVDVGQIVKKGQVLVSLDPTFAMADEAQVEVRLATLKVILKRLECELSDTPFVVTPDMEPTEAALQSNLYRGRQNEYRARMQAYDSRLAQAKDEAESFRKRLESLHRLLKTAEEVLAMRQQVFSEGADSRLSVLEAESKYSSVQSEAEGISNELKVRTQQMAQTASERDAFLNNWRNETANTLTTTRKEYDTLVEQRAKATRYRELAELASPVDAVVLDMGRFSVGSVAKEGDPIMTLVPLNVPLEAEVSIETKDVGYVHIGDPVRLKLDAFPFQRHGTMEGRLRVVSEDAYTMGTGDDAVPTYQARVELIDTTLHDIAKGTRFLPGMTLSAEIVVGDRRVITFLAYPLIRGLDESLREP
ncbi:HlyD family type I secretion periplasmic adaptor subunit [Desulfolutivibrio sulfoxidireducens]|uniref:HlyD family type I secretion periplasmic adaptor subunit n=1 Tax=Desulfolutivibrio sulfoxidireducens TaxID=2773299 RepID=UPI00159D2A69|nr:HlyD family type I secretion periplasmic adaptor subunit [Desulfolutivibrio sulfoxidireducens]QLA15998.1 HlyD family type I secretion periplasmic adaptor subunit [Desulfolutivibrio sulfoxidireducens]